MHAGNVKWEPGVKFELSAFSDVLQVPTMFEVVETSEQGFDKIFTTWPYLTGQRQNVLIVCGGGGSTRAIAEAYGAFFRQRVDEEVRLREVKRGTLQESRSIDAFCARENITLLVAIGGGKVLDTAKMVVKQRNIALLAVPSALSSDGVTSPIAVLQDDHGRMHSFPAGIPACVLVDLSVTARAPLTLTLSGIGDILSNMSALLDVDDYEAAGMGQVNGFAKLLSHSAYHMILPLSRDDIRLPAGQEAIARALILSGLSMAFAGNSLPCSGAEHLISHALDHIGAGEGTHGLQVAIATLYCLSLREGLGLDAGNADMRKVMSNLGLPMRPEDVGVTRDQFMEAVRLAPMMRTGRYTVLDRQPEEETLRHAYEHAFEGASA